MPTIQGLLIAKDTTWVDGIITKSEDTILYITICGNWQGEVLDALDCLWLDNKREFELIQLKKENRYIGVCVAMKPKKNNSI